MKFLPSNPIGPGEAPRLEAQQAVVSRCMSDGEWWTYERLIGKLAEVGIHTNGTAGVSARVRCLRQPEWGKHVVRKRKIGRGLYEFRIES